MTAMLTVETRFNGVPVASSTEIANYIANSLLKATERAMQAAAVEIRNALDKLYADLAAKHGNAWPGGTTESSLSVRSGLGLRSIKDSINVTTDQSSVTGVITTGSMTVHETGATITAKRAQYLTVPLTPALNSRGLPLRAKARDWDNTFIATSKRGNLIIFQKLTGGKIIPLYLLKKSVTLPPRLGMTEMFDNMIPYFEQKAIAAIEQAILNG